MFCAALAVLVYKLSMKIDLRRATTVDMASIMELYAVAYDGTYPDPTFTNVVKLKEAILSESKYLFVCEDENKKIIASILFLFDTENQIAKAGAAVVHPDARGHNITQKLIKFGIDYFNNFPEPIKVLYITTRTVHKAAQVLTSNMGFNQLGIFPNVHKTEDYETHALAAMHFNDAIKMRFADFEQHPKVMPLYELVAKKYDLPDMSLAQMWNEKKYTGKVPILEVIEAPHFVKHRINSLKGANEVDLGFFPFHTPSILITSANQSIEVFAYVNEVDKHCVITGCCIDREVSFTELFLKISNILRDRGIRYIEVILRANRLNLIDKITKAKFIPCGYIPAFQLEEDQRYDYVVFSRSFEILDFKNIVLTGTNQKYLELYIKNWEEMFLGDHFK